MTKVLRYILQGSAALGVLLAAPAFAQAATMSLSPSSGSHAASSTFEVKILLDTGGATTAGADANIQFDPSVLQVVDANSGTSGTQVLPGTLYSQTSFNSVDNTTGLIDFSGAKTSSSGGYKGSGTLATITFQAVKATSSTPVTFKFTSGETTDSNVSDADGKDLLTAVTDGAYTITAADGSSSSGTSSGTTGGSTTTSTSSDSEDSDGNGVPDSEEGKGGSGTVASTGIDLTGYAAATLIALIGAVYFLTRRPKHR